MTPLARRTAWAVWLRPSRIAIAALAAAVVVLTAADMSLAQQRDAAVAKRDAYATDFTRVAHVSKSWYMAGRDQWAGSGGTLYSPSKPDSPAYVVFHDLHQLAAGSVYALWLVDGDGHWTRAANFVPNGDAAQLVLLDDPVEGYTQCAVTVESSTSGRRTGPLIMQSRIG